MSASAIYLAIDPAVGDNGVTARATTGQQRFSRTPSSELKQLPAENIVQGF